MKTIKILSLILLSGLLFGSCSSDDADDNKSDEQTILGLWRLDERKINSVIDPLVDCDHKTTILFNSSEAINTNYKGVNCDIIEARDTSIYELNSNTIKIFSQDPDDDDQIFDILQFTASKLILKATDGTETLEVTLKR